MKNCLVCGGENADPDADEFCGDGCQVAWDNDPRHWEDGDLDDSSVYSFHRASGGAS